MAAKVYEGTSGFVIDVKINGVDSYTPIINAKLIVKRPRSAVEEEWPVTIETETGIFRHVVPADDPLIKGTYKIQPYFELGDFKGRWGAFELTVDKNMAI